MASFEKFTQTKEKNVFESLFGCDSSASSNSSRSVSRSSSFNDQIEDHNIVENDKITMFQSILFPECPIKIIENKSMGIAHQLWPAASFLGDFIAENPKILQGHVESCSRINLIELGAGLGLSGLFLAKYLNQHSLGIKIEKAILTDLPEAIPGLMRNIEINDLTETVAAQVLSWGIDDDVHRVMSYVERSNTVIVAADVVYWESLFTPLIDSLFLLCHRYLCTVYIAHVKRWKKDNKFFAICKKRHLAVELLREEVHTKKHEHTDDLVKEIRRIYRIHRDPDCTLEI
jgi:hypothetical protein